MKLRSHQELAIGMIRHSLSTGHKRPMVAAPVAFGKTVIAAQIMKNCQDKGKKGFFFCDRIQLVNQTIEKFQEFGIDFGVRQADHELTNPRASIQIASMQTIEAMVVKHGRPIPEMDLLIVDEAHVQRSIVKIIAEQFNNIPIIGLSATPYSKGLGIMYDDLLVPITPRELLEKGYLTPIRYYGGEHIDLSKIKSDSANQFNERQLERETDDQKEKLTGCIIENWHKYGEDSQTIAFTPSIAHSKYLVDKFNEAGISAEHIDGRTPPDERIEMMEAHDRGEFKVLSCSRLLNTGYDAPSVKCMIDCYPVKSVTTYVQRLGRIARLHESKQYAIYLDHASNFERFGYAEDIVPSELHDGTKPHNEKELTNQKDTKEAKTKECPQCYQQMSGFKCRSCGYEMPIREQLEDDGTMLKEITVGTAANKKDSLDIKTDFYSQLVAYGSEKGYKAGWSAMQYKEKYGTFPPVTAAPVSNMDMAKSWVRHQNIKKARSRKAGNETLAKLKGAA